MTTIIYNHCLIKTTKSSGTAEGLCEALCQLKSYQLLQYCMINSIWKGLQWVNDFKVTVGDRNCRYSMGDKPLTINAL